MEKKKFDKNCSLDFPAELVHFHNPKYSYRYAHSYACPRCDYLYEYEGEGAYLSTPDRCVRCNQKLDWSDEK